MFENQSADPKAWSDLVDELETVPSDTKIEGTGTAQALCYSGPTARALVLLTQRIVALEGSLAETRRALVALEGRKDSPSPPATEARLSVADVVRLRESLK